MTRFGGPGRIGAPLALVGLSVLTLTGCFLGDHVPPRASLINRTSASVTLTITGADVDPQDYPAREGRPVRGLGGVVVDGKEMCVGDGFLVTDTASGAVLITSDEPVCGDTTIIVEADPTPLTPPPAPPASTP